MNPDTLPTSPKVRTGQTPTKLTKEEYLKRWRERFYDPGFAPKKIELDAIAEIAWEAYDDARKSPRTRKAGTDFADPEYELSIGHWMVEASKVASAREIIDAPSIRGRLSRFERHGG